jgi:hypothetical protein
MHFLPTVPAGSVINGYCSDTDMAMSMANLCRRHPVTHRRRPIYGFRAAMWAAVRQARAMMVSEGLALPLVTWRLASAT